MITMRFWGVRGSIAAAGADTAQVGGNTSCVELRCRGPADEREELLILDAGTGLRGLGAALLREGGPVRASLLVSHFHWDHIQGFPFFGPAYAPSSRLALLGPAPTPHAGCVHGEAFGPAGPTDPERVRAAFAAQMSAPHFPVGLDAMRADLVFRTLETGDAFALGPASVRTAAARHPNGCLAYRVECGGRSVVYATDTEHPGDGGVDPLLLELARGADVLVYDAQYTSEEYAGKRGWGHSTAAEGARLAAAAGVGQLVLFHHDPSHDDWTIARIEAQTRAIFPRTSAAREGLVIGLPGRDSAEEQAA